MTFADRSDAGRRLADRLTALRDRDVVVLGLPRGGVPVAYEVAAVLDAPLDVIVVRKLGVPGQPELAMGAIGEGGVRVLNDDIVRMTRVSDQQMAEVERDELAELDRRARRFRGDRCRATLTGKVALVVDDGIATGATARAACQIARAQGAAEVVLAAPVAPAAMVASPGPDIDQVVALEAPDSFGAIGQFYEDFSQTTDDEVTSLLRHAAEPRGPIDSGVDEEVVVVTDTARLNGSLTVPGQALGLVVFAHGSGSSRFSLRNRAVAAALQRAGLGTLLFDLLTVEESHDRINVFDIPLLGERLAGATRWLRKERIGGAPPIGYFGASTGAAAALWAAAEPNADIAAVVSRGGRADLAGHRLGDVRAPTLLIVGGHDSEVKHLNQAAQGQLNCKNELVTVPGATHLFEEPGALDQVADLAIDWFVDHIR